MILVNQSLRSFPVNRQSFRLEIRAFIPVQPQPAQAIPYYVHRSLNLTSDVSIFNPQDKDPTVVASEKPVE
jgi:hypothetical protein